MYAFSLDLSADGRSMGVLGNSKANYIEQMESNDPEQRWYYKYCEDEWNICGEKFILELEEKYHLRELSKRMSEYADSLMDTEQNAKYVHNLSDKCMEVLSELAYSLMTYSSQDMWSFGSDGCFESATSGSYYSK